MCLKKMFSQTQSSWILAGWLNGTARPKEDLLLIHGTRLALKGPRNQDQETGESQPSISRFSSKEFHFSSKAAKSCKEGGSGEPTIVPFRISPW